MSAVPFKVKAVYEYKSAEPDDLNFPNGQIITVTTIEDDEWYTGNYVNATGDTREGMFPKNFVEKYEPAIPSRPKRAQPKAETPAEVLSVVPAQEPEDVAPSRRSLEAPREPEPEQTPAASPPAQAQLQIPPPAVAEPSAAPAKPSSGKPPPPVAEKPISGSFRDRIAAFNKTAAPPPTPFKPTTQNNSTGFIKKPFVAPPPSKNAYIPPPREQLPPRAYRREEDPEIVREEASIATERAEAPVAALDDGEDAPKPLTLKERMALLQKQQLEQAQRHAEGTQKKDKPKRPPKKRVEATENAEQAEATTGVALERVHTDETVGKKSVDFADDEAGPLRGNSKASHDRNMMATPPPPSRELVSDTNDADDSGAGDTEDAQETSTEEERPKSRHATGEHVPGVFTAEPEPTTHHREAEPEDEDEEEEADDTDEDPEIKRRREIRDRMARLGGGMGMMGMFGPPGGMPGASSGRKSRPSGEADRHASREQAQESETARAPPVSLMAMPGMTGSPPPPADDESDEESAQPTPQATAPRDLSDADDDLPAPPAPPTRKSTDRVAPPVPNDRGLPPLPLREARAVPPPPPTEQPALSHDNDFASAPPPPSRATRPQGTEDNARPQSKDGPPNLPPAPPRRPTEPARIDTSPPISPSVENKRLSRGPPPIPMSPTMASPQTRAPPPPPPGQPPSRRSTTDSRASSVKHPVENDSEEEITEYDGDYDTDIASSAKHKDALKSHNRDSSFDDGMLTDEATINSPSSPPARAVPSIPVTSAPRDIPPPLPPQNAPKSRKSVDAPRAAPPPVPPPKQAMDDDEYDPYRYNGPQSPIVSPPPRSGYAPVLASPAEEMEQDDMYDPTPTGTRSFAPPPVERDLPPPSSPALPITVSATGRPSMEASRASMQGRRSMEQSRPSGEHGIMATDIDLGQSSMWWTQANTPPPSLLNRPDVLYEIESSTSTKRGGKATTSTDIYVLYTDYSQTTINATFDPQDPSHATLEQRHDRPPPPPRKDQLEAASQQFGTRIAESAAAKLNTSVASGTPQDFILDLLSPLSSHALKPIGMRSFGALVYANLANTSTQVFDEIRPGDIVTFKNAKFGGHKGGLGIHPKYAVDVGMGREHVGVVAEWDGTKKKIRAWEQGREEKGKKGKVKEESWRMGDLRSGEVRVWRIMGREWVGWDSSK